MLWALTFLAVLRFIVPSEATQESFLYCYGDEDNGLWPLPKGTWAHHSAGRPSSRKYGMMFSAANNRVFLFGGFGYDDSGGLWRQNPTQLNDVWEFRPEDLSWRWLKGDKEHTGVCTFPSLAILHSFSCAAQRNGMWRNLGVIGTYAIDVTPGGKHSFAYSSGPNSTFLVYGGFGIIEERVLGSGRLDDLYQFDCGTGVDDLGLWRSLSGSSDRNPSGSVFLDGVWGGENATTSGYNVSNMPKSAFGVSAVSSLDKTTTADFSFWIFGGQYADPKECTSQLWEWKFGVDEALAVGELGAWRWVKGDLDYVSDGVYPDAEEKGVFVGGPDPSQHLLPPSRSYAMMWMARVGIGVGSERIFVFGGLSAAPFAYWSDLWAFDIGMELWAWISGSRFVQDRGSRAPSDPDYGSIGFFGDEVVPSARQGSLVGTSEDSRVLFLWGGVGVDPEARTGFLAELWAFNTEIGSQGQWMLVDPSDGASNSPGSSTMISGHTHAVGFEYGGSYYVGLGRSKQNVSLCGSGPVVLEMINDMWNYSFVEKCNGKFSWEEAACSGLGKCVGGACLCNSFHTGQQCEVLLPTCQSILPSRPHVCMSRGRCLDFDLCECDVPYLGQFCEELIGSGTLFDKDDPPILQIEYNVPDSVLVPAFVSDLQNPIINCGDILPPLSSLTVVGLNPACSFVLESQSQNQTLQFVVELGSEFTVEYNSDFELYVLSAADYPGTVTSVRIGRSPYPAVDGGVFVSVTDLLKKLTPLWVTLGLCCLLCVAVVVGGTGTWLGIYRKNREKVKEVHEKLGSDKMVDQALVDQQHLCDSSFGDLLIDMSIFNVPFEKLQILKVLASGGSAAVVYQVKYRNRECALKLFKTKDVATQSTFDAFKKEVTILAECDHPNVLEFYGCTLSEPRIGVVFEYCPNGDLRQYITNVSNERLVLGQKLLILIQIADVMAFLHERGVIHRDLKSDNVLLTEELAAKLIDFGLSRVVEGGDSVVYLTRQAGTSQYMAPEVTLSSRYDERCDVFSYGIMLFEILLEDFRPYGDVDVNIELKVALDPDFRPSIRERSISKHDCLAWVVDLMTECWDVDVRIRPSFAEIRDAIAENADDACAQFEKLDL